MILITRALATGSNALVLDEPTSALGRTRDRAILFTTHDPNHALVVADDVVMMMPGGAVVQGAVTQMITPDLKAELYGVPMNWVRPDGSTGHIATLPEFTGKGAL